MELSEIIKELAKDYQTISEIQEKYGQYLHDHMSLKKKQRSLSWDFVRKIVFHINGALCMVSNGMLHYLKSYNKELHDEH